MKRGARYVDTLTCYKEFAEGYDEWQLLKPLERAEEKVVLGLISDGQYQRCLDVGCGTGRYLKRLQDLCVEPVGIDFCRELIYIAQSKAERADFVVADALHLPLREQRFDLVLSTLVINHLQNYKQFQKM